MGKIFGSTTPTSPPNEASNQTSSEFEILSLPTPTTINENQNEEILDLRFGISSAQFDILPNEIEMRLRALLNENLELKDTLHENNAALNEQLGRLSKWQKDMELVQEQNKIKFEESRQLIKKFHEENTELRKQLDVVKENNSCKSQFIRDSIDESLKSLKKENDKLVVINLQLTEELKTNKDYSEQLRMSKNHLIAEKQELLATNNDLQTRLQAIENSTHMEMNIKPWSEVAENSLIIVQPCKQPAETVATGINELVIQLHTEQQKRSALTAELMEERKMRSLLSAELIALKENSEVQASVLLPLSTKVSLALGQKGEIMLNSIRDTELKLCETNKEYTGKTSALENRLSECQERLHSLNIKDEQLIKDLKLEIEDLRGIIAQEQMINKEDKISLNASHKQFENLLQDYQQLLHSWESYEHEQAKKGVQSVVYYDIQIKSLKEEIDRLTAQLIASEETIAAKVEDNNQLREQNKIMNREMEKVPILQAQLEIYQTDFRMEREACEKLGEEKEIALRQLHQLEARCQQLNEELEIYRRARYRHSSSHAYGPVESSSRDLNSRQVLPASSGAVQKTNVHHTQSAPINKLQKPTYFCPRCNLIFSELQPLENHVNICLSGNDPFL